MTSGEIPGEDLRLKHWPKHWKSARQCSEAPLMTILQHEAGRVSLGTRINLSQSPEGNYCYGDQQSHHTAVLPGNLEQQDVQQGRLHIRAKEGDAQSPIAGTMTRLEVLRS